MGDTATAAPATSTRPGCGRRSDGGLTTIGFLGDFARGHALFSLHRLGPDQSQYPNGPCEYLIDCDDGVGPHEVCRFTIESAEGNGAKQIDASWRGSWNNDRWCGWILRRALALIAASRTS